MTMKFSRLNWIVLAAVVGALAPASGHAEYRRYYRHWRVMPGHFFVRDPLLWRRGYWYHGPYGGLVGWWWIAGGTSYFYDRPYYPYPDPGLAPTYVYEVPVAMAPSPPPVQNQVIGVTTEQPPAPQPMPPVPVLPAPVSPPAAQVAAQAPQLWYFCNSSRAYYPYVSACPEGWVKVPATPPR